MINRNHYSSHKIVWHPEKMQSFLKWHLTAPIYVRIKPTNHCNHDCFYCVYKPSFAGMHALSKDREKSFDGKPSELSLEKLLEILKDFASMGVRAVTFSGGGEPLMHPDIVEVLDKAHQLGIATSLITNGQLLKDERAKAAGSCHWVRISMDYNSADQMAYSRGVSARLYDDLYDNLRRFSQSKKPQCELTCNFVVHRGNFDGLFETAKKLKESGVQDIRFSPMWIPSFHTYHRQIEFEVNRQLKQIQSLCDDNFSVSTTYNLRSSCNACNRRYSRCYYMEIVPVIAADACVYACHNKAYDPSGFLASLEKQSFYEAWFSSDLRRRMLELNPKMVCHHQCANDAKNQFLTDIVQSAGDNFV